MDSKQIAHDLAIAKLYGSTLSPDGMVKKYHEFVREFEIALGLTDTTAKTTITDRSKLGI